jgi:hypothetical protein
MQAGLYPVMALDDIIASKRATGRPKDVADVTRLEAFRRSLAQER